mmetsp:Transcript_29514/g.56705  ORF Transcript_29514/g.56705 Transcript_29514/m.56705 type:complete len:526 (-) Transcript_29514:543-2120(-)
MAAKGVSEEQTREVDDNGAMAVAHGEKRKVVAREESSAADGQPLGVAAEAGASVPGQDARAAPSAGEKRARKDARIADNAAKGARGAEPRGEGNHSVSETSTREAGSGMGFGSGQCIPMHGKAAVPACSRGAPRSSPPWRPSDKDGHLMYELGESLTPRYKILSKVGEGTFGRVLECWDRELRRYCAIKVIRNVQKYRDASMFEIDVLQKIAKEDPEGRWHCVALQEWLDYRGHVCMVFEKLGLSLYDFLRKNHYQPFSIDLVREFGAQLLESVAFLHDLTLVHTDLKPENILLQYPEYTRERLGKDGKHLLRVPVSHLIKVIDFGSATFNAQYHSSVVSTRHYRAPEVILGLGWTYPCDIWSIGCILLELFTGDALFQTHENLEHLAMMEMVLGPIPKDMIQASDNHCHKYFRKNMRELNWPEGASSRESVRTVRKLVALQDIVYSRGASKAHKDMVELVSDLLKYNPKDRLSARSALEHPFFIGATSLQHNMISSEKIQENPPRNVGQEDAVSVSAAGLLESK